MPDRARCGRRVTQRGQGRIQPGGGLVGNEAERPLPPLSGILHVLQHIHDFVASMGVNGVVEMREYLSGAADEIIETPPGLTPS